jgi:hypothetical protein
MSYLAGPNEGWISAKRNGFSLAIYDQLPEDIAAQIVPEFVSLVDWEIWFLAISASKTMAEGCPVSYATVLPAKSATDRTLESRLA